MSPPPRVSVDRGRGMSDGSPRLLKARQRVPKEQAEVKWKVLLRKGSEAGGARRMGCECRKTVICNVSMTSRHGLIQSDFSTSASSGNYVVLSRWYRRDSPDLQSIECA